MARCMHPLRVVPEQGIVYMKHLLILGFALAVLTATSAAQNTQPRVKHFRNAPKSTKRLAVRKTPAPASAEANLRRLEQQSTKLSAPPRVKRTPGTAAFLKAKKEKPNPPINFSGSGNGVKGPGTTNRGTNPYRGRLRQKGSNH
jgi:hypothetical protein